jgi:hypothetical protein
MSETNEKELTWEDHLAAAIKSFRKEMKEHRSDWLPGEFHEHHRAARREMLLAWRSLIDAGIEKLEKVDREKSEGQVTRIKVE